jgi:DNA-binding CsgD family transcriptional regulator
VSLRGAVWLVVGGVCGWTWASAVLAPRSPEPELSERQSAILALVARGMSTKEIARHEGISEHSVNTHIRRATKALGVGSRVAAVAVLRGDRQRERVPAQADPQAVTPPRPRRSATRSSAVTISATSSSNGT